ncbi:nitrate/nitrite sensor protein [Klebsiella michiganensis]|nr:nitrate/nitrite sensor protein [Klebsiella michiganensis]
MPVRSLIPHVETSFTPLTLVNQLALIVLLATVIGVAGMAISSRLVHGVQGSAHAINKAGSLRMQSYRLLAAVPLGESDQKLLDEMTATVFSPELQYAARHDDQQRSFRRYSTTGSWSWRRECAGRKIRPRSRRMSLALSIASTNW